MIMYRTVVCLKMALCPHSKEANRRGIRIHHASSQSALFHSRVNASNVHAQTHIIEYKCPALSNPPTFHSTVSHLFLTAHVTRPAISSEVQPAWKMYLAVSSSADRKVAQEQWLQQCGVRSSQSQRCHLLLRCLERKRK